MYQILPYTDEQARRIGVKIQPSKKPSKKIDVFDWHYNFICSVGANGYGDYPTFLKLKGKEFANERRRLYKIRHEKDRHRIGTPGYYADKLLW